MLSHSLHANPGDKNHESRAFPSTAAASPSVTHKRLAIDPLPTSLLAPTKSENQVSNVHNVLLTLQDKVKATVQSARQDNVVHSLNTMLSTILHTYNAASPMAETLSKRITSSHWYGGENHPKCVNFFPPEFRFGPKKRDLKKLSLENSAKSLKQSFLSAVSTKLKFLFFFRQKKKQTNTEPLFWCG